MQPTIPGKIFLIIIAIAGWFALTAQFYININSGIASIPELITRYFSYFTILTNFIVAISCAFLLFFKRTNIGKFFARPQTLVAVTIYIVIVGIIYNVILRSIWNPQGLQKIVDELLHTAIPILFLLYWIIFVKKGLLKWRNILPWMIYPLIYIIVILLRGLLSDFYPYPFIDINKIGVNETIVNSLAITGFFIILSIIFVAIDKIMKQKPAGSV